MHAALQALLIIVCIVLLSLTAFVIWYFGFCRAPCRSTVAQAAPRLRGFEESGDDGPQEGREGSGDGDNGGEDGDDDWGDDSGNADDGSDNGDSVTTGTGGTYRVVWDLNGRQLLDSIGTLFTFFTKPDPTHGFVTYAEDRSLLQVVEGTKLRINIGPDRSGAPRSSIRLMSTQTFDSGLLVLDVERVPHELSTWPAFWTTGLVDKPSGWALHGEIDILEQVNGANANTVTLHTNTPPGGTPCRMDASFGTHNQCDAPRSGTKICGYNKQDWCPYNGCGKAMGAGSFGKAFNDAGGGTFAMELTRDGRVSVWFWRRGEAVPDFANQSSSDGWRTSDPQNTVRFGACPGQFKRQQIVLNTNLCGDWASQQLGGDAKCREYVRKTDLSKSYWLINRMQLFAMPT